MAQTASPAGRSAWLRQAARGVPVRVHVLRHAPPVLLRRRQGLAAAQQTTTVTTEVLEVTIPTIEAKRCMTFDIAAQGTGQAVVVTRVDLGSAPEEAGVRVGMKLVAISDPIRFSEVWQLEDRPSLRWVTETLRLRSASTIDMSFVECDLKIPGQADLDEISLGSSSSSSSMDASSSNSSRPQGAADGTISLLETLSADGSALSSSDEAGAGMTVAEKLAAQYEQNKRKLTPVQQRIKARQEYQAMLDSRDDTMFLAGAVAALFVPALVGLAIAYGTGYLDHILNMQW